ncbi:MAG: hypothetical protein HY400_02195 [Elusimicrobia bacterium]|nr:hypothetical protein [Elusimicrobiota bacterium]
MKKLIILAIVAAAVYYGYIKFKMPSQKEIERVLPVQIDPRKGKQLVEKAKDVQEKANKVTEAVQELKEEVTEE